MQPKLIMINGPLGSGKSNLARYYAGNHPLTLFLDIDDIWAMFSHGREQKEIILPLSKEMAFKMANVNLSAGYDVVISQIIQTHELRDRLQELAFGCNAQFHEILLSIDKDEAIRRFIIWGKANSNESGFRKGGLIDTGGRDKMLSEMYDDMLEAADNQSDIIMIKPETH